MEELVRRVVDALNARDFDALAEVPLAPDFQFRSLISDSEGTYYTGLDGLREWARDVDEVFDDFRVEVLEVHPAPEDRAVITIRVSGSSKASGAPFSERNAQVWTWRDGQMWRNEAYSDPGEAKRAAGLTG
jgi:ketosteroid isomerase-like protein